MEKVADPVASQAQAQAQAQVQVQVQARAEDRAAEAARRRVAYVLSPELLRASDVLPSNAGRATLVHSLHYHLGLLDLDLSRARGFARSGELVSDDEDESEDGEDRDSYKGPARLQETLLDLLGVENASSDDVVAAQSDLEGKNEQGARHGLLHRATVIEPEPATDDQLRRYHSANFVEALLAPQDRARSSRSESEEAEEGLESTTIGAGRKRKRGKSGALTVSEDTAFGLQDDCPRFDMLAKHVRYVAGAAISAAEELAEGRADVVIVWDGGRHHAKKAAASGFCYVNDAVLAILALRKPRRVTVVENSAERAHDVGAQPSTSNASTSAVSTSQQETSSGHTGRPKRPKTKLTRVQRIFYLDLDLHWGDGVEEAFYNTPNVLTLSLHMHAPGFFPCSEKLSDGIHGPPGALDCAGGPVHPDPAASHALSLPLRPGASATTWERVMRTCVQPLVEGYDPEIIVVQCGCDGLVGDPNATWNLDVGAFQGTLSQVLSWKRKTMLLGGGGYDHANAARCWALMTATALGRTSASGEGEKDGKEEEGKAQKEGLVDRISAIPEHVHWPSYAPSYTLDVPQGSMQDSNDDEYLLKVEKTLASHIQQIRALNVSSSG